MILEKLSLQNFRNYKQREFEFSPILTLIIGPNTAGKTNIVEAIYLVATGRSFRAGVEKEMIRSGEELARVQGKIFQNNSENSVSQRHQRVNIPVHQKIRESDMQTHRDTDGLMHRNTDTLSSSEFSDLEILVTTGSVQGRKAPYKKYLVNGVGRRKSDFVGNFYAVVFHPQDIELITDSPSRRRSFLDNVLIQTSSEYARVLTAYEKALRRRNKILSKLQDAQNTTALPRTSRLMAPVQGRHSVVVNNRQRGGELEYWDRLLVESGQVLEGKRKEFIEFLNSHKLSKNLTHVREYFRNIFQFKVEYDKSEISFERLKKYGEREVAAGYTLIGPHRDDFQIIVQQAGPLQARELSAYGSRGEQRLAVLWLKMGELEYLKEKTGERPVLLLDDIFSELDHGHRRLVSNIIPDYQTIITTADEHNVSKLTNMQGVKIVKIE